MRVSVVVTVLNEGTAIHRLLDSLVAQTRRPDEVMVVDGGSRDGTVAALRAAAQSGRLPLKLLVEPGANISRGRNVAIAAASGDVIASTDAGVRLTPDWLAALLAPFEGHKPPQVVSGVFVPDAHNTFETAMSATVLPAVGEVNPATFLPSSRSVAFTRSAWQAVGGYPEWLDYCEDLVFDLRLRERFHPFGYAPQAVAYFRPRGSLRTLLQAVLPLRAWRRQGRSLAQAPPHSLPDLSGRPAVAPRAWVVEWSLVVGGRGRDLGRWDTWACPTVACGHG